MKCDKCGSTENVKEGVIGRVSICLCPSCLNKVISWTQGKSKMVDNR